MLFAQSGVLWNLWQIWVRQGEVMDSVDFANECDGCGVLSDGQSEVCLDFIAWFDWEEYPWEINLLSRRGCERRQTVIGIGSTLLTRRFSFATVLKRSEVSVVRVQGVGTQPVCLPQCFM